MLVSRTQIQAPILKILEINGLVLDFDDLLLLLLLLLLFNFSKNYVVSESYVLPIL